MQLFVRTVPVEAINQLGDSQVSRLVKKIALAKGSCTIGVWGGPNNLDIFAIFGENVDLVIESDQIPPDLDRLITEMSQEFCRFCC